MGSDLIACTTECHTQSFHTKNKSRHWQLSSKPNCVNNTLDNYILARSISLRDNHKVTPVKTAIQLQSLLVPLSSLYTTGLVIVAPGNQDKFVIKVILMH